MSLTLHTISAARGARQKKFRVGRGNASGRGTTAGRGTKGQRARTGGRKRLKLKGLKQMLLSFPKLRGFHSRRAKAEIITLTRVCRAFQAGSRVDLASLKSKGIISRAAIRVKLIGKTGVERALTFIDIPASAQARAAVEKSGGAFVSLKKINRGIRKTVDGRR